MSSGTSKRDNAAARRKLFAAFFCLTFVAVWDTAGARDTAAPHRGQGRRSPPLSQTAPDTTGTVLPRNGAASGAPAPSQADEEALPPLFNLPDATRTRMRRCGEKWRAIKMAGDAGEEIWRDFATKCLAAKN